MLTGYMRCGVLWLTICFTFAPYLANGAGLRRAVAIDSQSELPTSDQFVVATHLGRWDGSKAGVSGSNRIFAYAEKNKIPVLTLIDADFPSKYNWPHNNVFKTFSSQGEFHQLHDAKKIVMLGGYADLCFNLSLGQVIENSRFTHGRLEIFVITDAAFSAIETNTARTVSFESVLEEAIKRVGFAEALRSTLIETGYSSWYSKNIIPKFEDEVADYAVTFWRDGLSVSFGKGRPGKKLVNVYFVTSKKYVQ